MSIGAAAAIRVRRVCVVGVGAAAATPGVPACLRLAVCVDMIFLSLRQRRARPRRRVPGSSSMMSPGQGPVLSEDVQAHPVCDPPPHRQRDLKRHAEQDRGLGPQFDLGPIRRYRCPGHSRRAGQGARRDRQQQRSGSRRQRCLQTTLGVGPFCSQRDSCRRWLRRSSVSHEGCVFPEQQPVSDAALVLAGACSSGATGARPGSGALASLVAVSMPIPPPASMRRCVCLCDSAVHPVGSRLDARSADHPRDGCVPPRLRRRRARCRFFAARRARGQRLFAQRARCCPLCRRSTLTARCGGSRISLEMRASAPVTPVARAAPCKQR